MSGEQCASCFEDMAEDDMVGLTEGADILCESCAEVFVAEMGADELAGMMHLHDVHEDWRTR